MPDARNASLPATRRQPVEPAIRILADYLRFRYTKAIVGFYTHIRSLPPAESRMTWAAVAVTAVAVVATPLLASLADRLTSVTFQDPMGNPATIPVAAIVLACAMLAAAFGYLLSGAAQGPGLLWIFVSLTYIYLFGQIGLAIGRSYLHAVPLTLPVVIGAASGSGSARPWAKIVVLVAASSIMVRIVPLPPAVRASWYALWIPAAGLLYLLHRLVNRRDWAFSLRVASAAWITGAYLLAVAALASSGGQIAEGINLSLNSAIGYLEALWFLLGASYVAGAIALGLFLKKVIETSVPKRALTLLLTTVWATLAIWSLSAGPVGAHPMGPWAMAAFALLAAVFILHWRTHGLSNEWTAGWFVLAVAVVGILSAYAARDVRAVLTKEAGVWSLIGLTYAMVWEVSGRLPRVPATAAGLARPAPLVLYLGVILLVGAASLFGLAANLRFFQQVVVLQEYHGATALWIPLTLMAVINAWPAVSPPIRRRAGHAFVIAAVAAVPAFLLRMAVTPYQATAGQLLVAAALAATLVHAWPEVTGPLDAAVVGTAVGLGFAISLLQRVLVDLLPPLLTTVSALSGIREVRASAVSIFEASGVAAWSMPDQLLLYVVGSGLAIAAAMTVAIRRHHRRGYAD